MPDCCRNLDVPDSVRARGLREDQECVVSSRRWYPEYCPHSACSTPCYFTYGTRNTRDLFAQLSTSTVVVTLTNPSV